MKKIKLCWTLEDFEELNLNKYIGICLDITRPWISIKFKTVDDTVQFGEVVDQDNGYTKLASYNDVTFHRFDIFIKTRFGVELLKYNKSYVRQERFANVTSN
jgi:hypothetical protein